MHAEGPASALSSRHRGRAFLSIGLRQSVRRLCIAAAVFGSACAHGPRPPPAPPLAALLERANKSGKGIVVEFTASWCPSCDRFDAVVYPTDEVQAVLRELEFVRYDVERNQDPEYLRRLGFRGALPLFVALDAAGVVRGRFTGLPDDVRDAAEVLRQAAMLCASEGRIRSLEAGAGDDAETLLWVARWYRARGRIREAAMRIDRALSLPSVPENLRAALQKAREDPLRPARE